MGSSMGSSINKGGPNMSDEQLHEDDDGMDGKPWMCVWASLGLMTLPALHGRTSRSSIRTARPLGPVS